MSLTSEVMNVLSHKMPTQNQNATHVWLCELNYGNSRVNKERIVTQSKT